MKSETLADKKECEMKQSNDTVLCDLIPDSLQLNPQKHLLKMLIPHGGRENLFKPFQKCALPSARIPGCARIPS